MSLRTPPDPLSHPPSFTLHVHHFFHYPALEAEMSRLSGKIDELASSTDAALGRVQEDVDALRAKVAELEGNVTTDADIARIDELKAKIDALDPVKPDTLPEGDTPA
jgi:outer membrane murein-binding lipoprotein Lpp